MLRALRALQRVHLAGLRQQRPQSGDLHHVQHRVQTGLHQDPQLLSKSREKRVGGGGTDWILTELKCAFVPDCGAN